MLTRRNYQKKVHVVGSYGHMNYGDDLFVDTVLKRQSELWPSSKVKTFAPIACPLYAQNGLVGRFLRAGTALTGLGWAKTIAFCGGSILQDVKGVDSIRLPFLSFRRVEALGVSLGPFRNQNSQIRVEKLLSKVDRLIVRDHASIKRWEQLSMTGHAPEMGGDLVALNPSIKPAETKAFTVTICPSGASRIPSTVLNQQALTAIRKIHSTTGTRPTVKILALAATPGSNDIPLSLELSSFLQTKGFDPITKTLQESSLQEITSDIAQSSIVLSQRLHGGIVAYLTETPFILVGHHAKCVDFADDIGLDKELLVEPNSDWSPGILRILSQSPLWKMEPTTYRLRAEQIYLSKSTN